MRRFVPGLAALLCLADPAAADDARALLRTFALEDADWREAEAGGVAVRVLDTPHRREVAAVALVRVDGDRASFLAATADAAALKETNPDVTAAGALSRPPRAVDLAGVAVDDKAAAALAACRPGACAQKLDDAAMERLARAVDWTAADAREQAALVLRERLAAVAAAYAARGADALPTIHDRPLGVDGGGRARELALRAPRLDALSPEAARHLAGYPRSVPGVVADAIVWSREGFWRRQVLSLSHLAAFAPDRGGPVEAVVVLRQLDANHYFEAALTVTALVAAGDARYAVRLYRFETDHKGGGFNFLERALIRRSARKRLERQMEALRARCERARAAR